MTSENSLQRSAPSPFVPVPRAVRVGSYIHTSLIYPIDDRGHAVEPDAALGEAGPSAIEVQARHCFKSLAAAVAELGGDLASVLKVDVHLAFAQDFYEFRQVWAEVFPSAPPAMTVAEVGDTFPFRGVRLNLDAVCLAADSGIKRTVLKDPEGSDSVGPYGASHAVRAGNLIFCSGFPATDFKTGLAVGKKPGFPYYGNEARMQAEHVFDRLDRILAQAGTSTAQVVESQLYEPDLNTFHDIDSVWGARMPLPPTRSSMGVKGLLIPGARFAPNFVVLVPDEKHQKQDSRAGLRWHPVDRRGVNFSPTIKAGNWRYFSGQVPTADMQNTHQAPPGLPNHFSNIEEQTEFTLGLLTEQITANDTDWQHCYAVRVFLIEPRRDYRGFIRVWKKFFPDPSKAPALAYVPSTEIMFPGPLIEIDPSCVAKS